ncbi:hypothetical protein GCM10020295_45710 [Streptomyces cinereospinus]
MHRLAGDVAVDQRLGQAFRQVRGAFQGAQPGGEGHRARALRAERDPHVPPADLVTGPLDQQPAPRAGRRIGRREPRAQPLPRAGDLRLVVLPQDVGRADEVGPLGKRDLEAAVPEGEPSRAYGRAAATRAGSISTPTTRAPGAAARSRTSSSTAVQGAAP